VTDVPESVTRVVLVHPGGFTEKWAESWDIHIQDDGRTLKLFPRNPAASRYEWDVLEVPAGVLEAVVGKMVGAPIETTETEEKQ
jgi:hypothetical protein